MEDKNVEMIGKLLDVCKKLKETIESQASVIFKLHAQMQSQDDRIKSLELTLEDNPDKYQNISNDNEDYFVQPND